MRPWVAVAALLPATLGSQSPLDSAARLIDRREYAAAKPLLAEASAVAPSDARVAYWMGRIAYGEQDFDHAVEQIERAVALDPTSSAYHMWLGRAYGRRAQRANTLRQMGLARKAKGAMERAVALDPENLAARRDLMEYYLAAPRIAGGSKDKAKGEMAEIRRRSAYAGHLAAGRVAEAEGDTTAGVREYEAAIALAPDSGSAYYRLGNILTARSRWADA
ncbi:MAG TPA: tetratricopeptide repeat protein, partial [Gemmatimonadaceae bacterium]|nr:tetratricopeptide repeat protein [Gemmatimonadaceae bacterium]